MASIIFALFICAFVFVIKETLMDAGEDEFDYY